MRKFETKSLKFAAKFAAKLLVLSWQVEKSSPQKSPVFSHQGEKHTAGKSDIWPTKMPTRALTKMHTKVLTKMYTKVPVKVDIFCANRFRKSSMKILTRVLSEKFDCPHKNMYTKWFSRAAKRGGFKRGVSRSGLVLPFLSFFVLFATFPIFPGFSRFVRGLFGDFSDLSFSSFLAY